MSSVHFVTSYDTSYGIDDGEIIFNHEGMLQRVGDGKKVKSSKYSKLPGILEVLNFNTRYRSSLTLLVSVRKNIVKY
jgi:hypothetical protein